MKKRASVASVGIWAGGGFAALTLVYLVTLTVMMARGLPFPPQEPFTTTFHAIMMLGVVVMVPLWCAIHLATPADKQVFTLISLAFVVMLAVVVCANRFVALTMVRQSPGLGRTAGLEWFEPYGWPSLTFALEVLGWGVFFSLACLFLAPAFRVHGLERAIAVTFAIVGVLSLGGTLGLFVNSTGLLGVIAPLAWGLGPAAAAVLVTVWLRTRAYDAGAA
ncbi:hypothetical protein Misp01_50240 [Microtetraspora sp. NBRC 13810]|uniref:hypothetical protein n=1 Tax=Microtetraspora sp. NBRC 13810 TaxID=3030990 RepID=UPI0024A0EFC5|nr:hypothetical protein [Microtetraspora sp. NBRC 13810]GLW09895.1 hypothetical protein Misp01_50240 [Microtetraspora sp. NBRC 13810]